LKAFKVMNSSIATAKAANISIARVIGSEILLLLYLLVRLLAEELSEKSLLFLCDFFFLDNVDLGSFSAKLFS
jgi:hypothetical protein